jgi:hypothetical protein
MLSPMDPISAGGLSSATQSAGSSAESEDMAMLKASQDAAKQHAAQLLEALPPPPRSPSPPGTGGNIDLMA